MNRNETKKLMYTRIRHHGEQLMDIFGIDGDPIDLCKKLRRLEARASRLKSNRYTSNKDGYDDGIARVTAATKKIIGAQNMPKICIDDDPRGYALKLTKNESAKIVDQKISIYRDFDGHVVLAPDFNIFFIPPELLERIRGYVILAPDLSARF